MKQLTSLILLCILHVLSYAQNVRVEKMPSKFEKQSAYEKSLKSPFVWINDNQVYCNYDWLKKKESPYVYNLDINGDFKVTKTEIPSLANNLRFAKFLKVEFAGKKLNLVRLYNETEKKSGIYTYSLNNGKIVPDKLVYTLNNTNDMEYYYFEGETIVSLTASADNSFYLFAKTNLSSQETKYSYTLFDSTLDELITKEISFPKTNKEETSLLQISVSNSGNVLALFNRKNLSDGKSQLFVKTISSDDGAALFLDFGANTYFSSASVDYYNDEDAHIIGGIGIGTDNGYIVFDTHNEIDGVLSGEKVIFNSEGSKYVYDRPALIESFTFENGNQIFIFKTNLDNGRNRLMNGLKIIALSPENKIISQYDIIRDVGNGEYHSPGEDTYVTYYNDELYVFFSGLKGESTNYTFEQVAQKNKDERIIKYLKISDGAKISEFDIKGTETLYIAANGADRTDNRILTKAYSNISFGMGGYYGESGLIYLVIE